MATDLAPRVIPCLLLRGHRLVKGVCFSQYREAGLAKSTLRVLTAQDPDEIILINISKSQEEIDLSFKIIESTVEETDVPLTIGGGIRSLPAASKLISMGVEKVLVTSALIQNPKLITQIAEKYGSQSVVAGIEYEEHYELEPDGRKKRKDIERVLEYSQILIERGAGELFAVSKSRDGQGQGLDLELLKRLSDSSRIPLIGMGGVGNFDHLVEGFIDARASAIACGSLFTFGDNNPIRSRAYLANNNVPVRRLR